VGPKTKQVARETPSGRKVPIGSKSGATPGFLARGPGLSGQIALGTSLVPSPGRRSSTSGGIEAANPTIATAHHTAGNIVAANDAIEIASGTVVARVPRKGDQARNRIATSPQGQYRIEGAVSTRIEPIASATGTDCRSTITNLAGDDGTRIASRRTTNQGRLATTTTSRLETTVGTIATRVRDTAQKGTGGGPKVVGFGAQKDAQTRQGLGGPRKKGCGATIAEGTTAVATTKAKTAKKEDARLQSRDGTKSGQMIKSGTPVSLRRRRRRSPQRLGVAGW